MDFNPTESPVNSSTALHHGVSGNDIAESSCERNYVIGERAFSGIQATTVSSLSNHPCKIAQTLPAACESSGSSDNIEFQSTCTASAASAIGQQTKAEDTYKITALSAPANKPLFRAEGFRTVSYSTISQGTVNQGEENTGSQREGNWKFFGTSVNQNLKVDDVVEKIDSGQLWVVNSRRRNGIIVMREFHAEFAGPGAAVGGDLDSGIVKIIPIGNLSLLEPDSHEEHQNAIKIRLQWIRLTQNFTDQASPDDRARMILEQFKTYFDQATVDLVPDEAFAMLVGVLPQTIHRVRTGFVW
ncbi:MAG: hypothetical protein ABG776_18610 [Cyanobacteria bacterium J06555_13]